MSGGFSEGFSHRADCVAGDIEQLVEDNGRDGLDEYGNRIHGNYPPAIIERFEEAAHALRRAAEMVRRIDLLQGGDDGEESFLSRWAEEVRGEWIDRPDRVSFWYMHDNHTFTRLEGTFAEIKAKARALGFESPYGMLCAPTLLHGERELRRLGKCVHSRPTTGLDSGQLEDWEAEIRGDRDAMRLLGLDLADLEGGA